MVFGIAFVVGGVALAHAVHVKVFHFDLARNGESFTLERLARNRLENQAEQCRAVSREFNRNVRNRAQVLLFPGIADFHFTFYANVCKVAFNGLGRVVIVEERHGNIAILQGLGPNLLAVHVGDAMALNAQRILVDGNHVLVQVEFLGLVAHVAHVGTDHDGSSHDGPHRHLGALFFVREAPVAYFEHVRVVPMTGLCNLPVLVVGIDNFVDAAVPGGRNPFGTDVKCSTPEVSDFRHPVLVFPHANAEHDIASGIAESVGHCSVIFFLRSRIRVAVVVLPVVNAPFGEFLGILLFVAIGTAFTLPVAVVMVTGTLAAVAIKTELQALIMHVVSDGLHAARESLRVVLEVALRIALGVHPVVVEVQVNVARIPQARRDHGIGNFLNLLFVDVFVEHVPAVPPQRGRKH